MDKQLESILNKAPSLRYQLDSPRYDSVANYIEDLEWELYWFDEEGCVEEAKETFDLVKLRANVSKYTLMGAKRTYENVKKEYAELKNHLRYVKKYKS